MTSPALSAASFASVGLAMSIASVNGPIAELEDVAEQHQAIDALDRVGKGVERLGAREKVGFRGRAEVEVRDDRGPHAAPILPCAW